jgi:hypothetical protein
MEGGYQWVEELVLLDRRFDLDHVEIVEVFFWLPFGLFLETCASLKFGVVEPFVVE